MTYTALLPSLVTLSISAPLANNICTINYLSKCTAKCNGVHPIISYILTSAPLFTNSSATYILLALTAMCRALVRSSSSWLTFAPFIRWKRTFDMFLPAQVCRNSSSDDSRCWVESFVRRPRGTFGIVSCSLQICI